MADKFGYKKGAKGIDGDKGSNFTDEGRDTACEKAMYGQSWWGEDGTKDITGEEGMGHSLGGADLKGNKMLKSAVPDRKKFGKG